MRKPPYNYDVWLPKPVMVADEWVYPGYVCADPDMDTMIVVGPASQYELTLEQQTTLLVAEKILQSAIDRRFGVGDPELVPVPPATSADTNVSDYVKAAWSASNHRPETETSPPITSAINTAAFVRQKWA